MVGKVVDELLKQGAEVVYEKMYDVHVSGHACQEELKIMMSITKPKYLSRRTASKSICVKMPDSRKVSEYLLRTSLLPTTVRRLS